MPTHIKLIGQYGNGLVVLLCILGLVASLANGTYGGALVLVIAGGLATFNVYVISMAARYLGEEEWLKAEVRKAELRHRLVDLSEADETPRPGERP